MLCNSALLPIWSILMEMLEYAWSAPLQNSHNVMRMSPKSGVKSVTFKGADTMLPSCSSAAGS